MESINEGSKESEETTESQQASKTERGKLFKSRKKIRPFKRPAQQDVINVAYKFLQRKASEPAPTLPSTSNSKHEDDEFHLFGMLMAEKLRKMDSMKRQYVMNDISNIMFKAAVSTSPFSSGRSNSSLQSSPAYSTNYSAPPSPILNPSSTGYIFPLSPLQTNNQSSPYAQTLLSPHPPTYNSDSTFFPDDAYATK